MAWGWLRTRPKSDTEWIERATSGDRRAAAALAERLLPVVQKRVAWVLSRRGAGRREDVLDYAQDAMVRLFERDGRILKTWDPAKGASLETFTGLVAEREVLSALRSGRRSAWREDPTIDVDLDRKFEGPDLEQRLGDRDVLERLLDHLEVELSPRARGLFQALYMEEQAPDDVAERFGMSLNALYSWRSRFKARVDVWLQEEQGR